MIWCDCVSTMIFSMLNFHVGLFLCRKDAYYCLRNSVPFIFAEIVRVVFLNDQLWKGKPRWAIQNPPPLPWQFTGCPKGFENFLESLHIACRNWNPTTYKVCNDWQSKCYLYLVTVCLLFLATNSFYLTCSGQIYMGNIAFWLRGDGTFVFWHWGGF